MPIKFGKPSKRPSFLTILIPDPGVHHIAMIGHDEKFHRETDLHYLVDINRSVPCMHEECRYHHLPVRTVVYVPAAVFIDPKLNFQPRILAVTDGWRSILDQDLKKWLFAIKRKAGKTSTVGWAHHREVTPDVPPYPGVDILPSLLRAWGFKDASPVEQGELFK